MTVCGVYNEGTKKGNRLTISAVCMPGKSFRRAMARDIALLRTSVRPIIETTCSSWDDARDQFAAISRAMVGAVEAKPEFIFQFPNVARHQYPEMLPKAKAVARVKPTAEKASIGEPVVTSLPAQLQTA